MKSEFKKIAIICASERELAPFLPLIENPTISGCGFSTSVSGEAQHIGK